jgi:sugar O-acyltransferase (sialic acid O-acetyltransferase NeuD family)
MKKQLVIFGFGEIAQLAYFYFRTDSEYSVAAFTINEEFITDPTFCGLPVVPFEEIVERFPPEKYEFFIALGYSKINAVRKEKYLAAKALGYRFASYVSSRATILNEGQIGENCFIFEDNTVQPFVKIGNNVTLWSGNHIGHHSKVDDNCFISSHVVISGGVTIGKNCFLGVNSTINNAVSIGDDCLLSSAALVVKNIPEDSIVKGRDISPVSCRAYHKLTPR